MPCVSRRPGLRTDGDGASRTNPGVLVTHVWTLFRSAVGLPSCVQRRQAKNATTCNTQELPAADVRFDRLTPAQDPALALKLSPAASPCTRPPMASSLKKSKVGQGRWRRAEAVRSSPQATSPQPGDQPPCLHCLSMQTTVVCVGACVPAFVRVHAYARV